MSAPPKRARFLSTGQVARKLGFSDDWVRRRCDDKTIAGAFRIGHSQWRVPAEWVEAHLRSCGVLQ